MVSASVIEAVERPEVCLMDETSIGRPSAAMRSIITCSGARTLSSHLALQMREKVKEAVLLGFQTDPDFIKRSLATLNSEAVAQCKTSDHVAAVVAFCKLFERAKRKNLIHPEMHVCHR